MRIGTWNLNGEWQEEHAAVIAAMNCDVLLLTEVPVQIELPEMAIHFTDLEMITGVRWSAVASRSELHPLPDPHGASAMATVDGLVFCSSVLPWNGCRPWWKFAGNSEAEWTANAVSAITTAGPHVWGGDWNHTLSGAHSYGSNDGRRSIHSALDTLGLKVVTSTSAGRLANMCSIDHIALGSDSLTRPAKVIRVDERVSDHDAYVVETVLAC